MIVQLLSIAAQAGSDVPLPVAATADFAFQGQVSAISECLSPDGTRPWTFVQFTVLDEIIGTGTRAPGEAVGKFTVRMPAGTHPDGTYSAIMGSPKLSVGDQLIVPVHAGNGTPGFLPLFLRGDGALFRVFPDGQGGTVVTADGKLLQDTSIGRPLPGVIVRPSHAVEPESEPVDTSDVADAITEYRTTIAYDGTTPPSGEWVGRLRVQSEEPVVVEGVGTFATRGDCNAHLSGTYNGSTLSMTGWCNARRAGKLDVILNGTRSGGHWTGTLRLSAAFDSTLAGIFTWSDYQWSTVRDFPDGFTAHTTGAQIANSVPDEYIGTFTLGEDPKRNIDFLAAFDGRRKPMTIAAFKNWLEAEAADHGNSGRAVNSIVNNATNCTSVSVVAIP